MTRWFVSTLGAALISASAGNAAVMTFTFSEMTDGVTVTGEGAFDLTGYASFGSTSGFAFLDPAAGTLGAGSPGTRIYRFVGGDDITYGTGSVTDASAQSGDTVFYDGDAGSTSIGVAPGYVSDAPLTFTMRVDGASFASLGITPVDQTATFANNRVHLVFAEIPTVPVPAALPTLLAGPAGLCAAARRRA